VPGDAARAVRERACSVSRHVHRILLELDDGATPVTGRVCPEGAEPRPFVGWTALISAVLAATARPADVLTEETPSP